ncbi:ATP-binding cassette domain-containing protein [Streptomyces sp. NPDC059740]|uniref:ABC transporter ATP-binding protein n=1 Tax=Streptomyces sp. NPDC059740 TaxID=3346926 RepID=UPI00364720AC
MTTNTLGGPPAVVFSGVDRTFGAVRAVDGLDLRIARGETVSLLGRNGAGKSTALSMLLGLLPPTRGEVTLFGDTPERAVAAGRVGAMLQDGRPVPRVTVRELVGFVADTYPRPMGVAEALRLAGLSDLADRRVDRLSGGQAQRVRFATALVGNPELVVLDEPTAALDVEARRAFWGALRAYAGRGNTVLFSTHYLEEAEENADRIVVVHRGRVVADGSGEALRQSVGGSLVSFEAADGPPPGLRELAGVTSVTVRGARVRLRSADSDATVLALADRGLVRRLRVAPASLEDAFLALTADGTDDPDGPGSSEDTAGTLPPPRPAAGGPGPSTPSRPSLTEGAV